jgi:hypothetical protein
MRLAAIVISSILCAFLYGDDSHLSPRFQTVYILEMENGFNQHLASRLTTSRVLWVVLDPKSADAVLTESLDDSFVSWMQRTYTPGTGGAPSNDASTSTVRKATGHGTVFLVDPRRRIVLWSAYDLPRNASTTEADRAATRLTNELKLAFGRK